MNNNDYLEAMGIQVWKPRRVLPFAKQVEQKVEQQEVEQELEQKLLPENETEGLSESWAMLQQQVSQCTACELHETRSNTVFGVGNLQADWLIVGEAPNEEEEQAGEPFVGSAGHMLNQMLLAIGVSREEVFIVDIIKCRPPLNQKTQNSKQRDPKQEECVSCQPFLLKQIEIIKPKVILSVGRIASQSLLKTKETISHLRGSKYVFEEADIPLVPTFHPAYLLRSPMEKSKVWSDLLLAKKVVEGRL